MTKAVEVVIKGLAYMTIGFIILFGMQMSYRAMEKIWDKATVLEVDIVEFEDGDRRSICYWQNNKINVNYFKTYDGFEKALCKLDKDYYRAIKEIAEQFENTEEGDKQ